MAKIVKKNKIPKAPSFYTCSLCGTTKKDTEFYMSKSPRFTGTKKVPYCKSCIKKGSLQENGNIDLEKFKNMLKEIDKPFICSMFNSAATTNRKDVIGEYIKNISSLPPYKDFVWDDSVFEAFEYEEIDKDEEVIRRNIISTNEFDLTDEIIEFFGAGYTKEEYQAMKRKYEFMKNNYAEKTNMHIEALKTWVRYKVKEEMATAEGSIGDAKQWAALSRAAATDAKINPSQLTKADLSDGLSAFSELSQAVEGEVDIISILPRFKYSPADAIDFNIWCYVNYIRHLKGLPDCKYEDVYKFYDKRKKDYIKQYGDPYGIFVDDTTERNRDNIKKFIKVEGE